MDAPEGIVEMRLDEQRKRCARAGRDVAKMKLGQIARCY
jgi:hypothetical protein